MTCVISIHDKLHCIVTVIITRSILTSLTFVFHLNSVFPFNYYKVFTPNSIRLCTQVSGSILATREHHTVIKYRTFWQIFNFLLSGSWCRFSPNLFSISLTSSVIDSTLMYWTFIILTSCCSEKVKYMDFFPSLVLNADIFTEISITERNNGV